MFCKFVLICLFLRLICKGFGKFVWLILKMMCKREKLLLEKIIGVIKFMIFFKCLILLFMCLRRVRICVIFVFFLDIIIFIFCNRLWSCCVILREFLVIFDKIEFVLCRIFCIFDVREVSFFKICLSFFLLWILFCLFLVSDIRIVKWIGLVFIGWMCVERGLWFSRLLIDLFKVMKIFWIFLLYECFFNIDKKYNVRYSEV